MRLRLTFSFAAAAALLLGGAAPAPGDSAIGRWLTPNGEGVIEIRECGAQLCGRIVGMSDIVGRDGHAPTDPDGNPQCGLTILHATKSDAAGTWSGSIENPNDGTTWTCEIWVAADGLHLRGYVLLPALGRTQLWRRFAGRVAPDCRFSG